MSNFNRTTLILLVVAVLVNCKPESNEVLTSHLDANILDQFINDVYHTYPLPGIIVGVVTEDTSYFKSMGYSNFSGKVAISDSTVFFSGGFSELMVATAALSLQEEGKISLADKVVTHLPYFMMQGPYSEVSIHHLLSHTSGIPHFNPAWDMPSYEEDALEATTRSIAFQELEFLPGKKRKSSPYNFDIAADLLTKVQNRPFEQIVREQVFEPLDMSMSSFDLTEIPGGQLARPHQVGNWLSYNLELHEPYPYTRENAGSFGLHTTAKDIAKWMKMVLRHDQSRKVLSNGSLNELMQAHYQMGEQTFKGYGWEIIQSAEGLVYNNSWNVGGFSGDLSLFPDKKIGIVVMANTSDDFNPTVISQHIAHHLKGGLLDKVKFPVHIEMSRQLAAGRSIDEVLSWYGDLVLTNDDQYLLKPSLLGQLGVNLLHRLSRSEDALKVFRFCVEKYPDSPEAHLNLTEALLAFGQIDDAERHLKAALNLNDQLNSPYVNFLREQLAVAIENRSSS